MDTPDQEQQSFCSILSRQAGEGLEGSATQTNALFLLQYDGAWGSKAFEESDLAQEVKAHLSEQLKRIQAARLLLIKRPQPQDSDGICFFAAATSEVEPALYAFRLERYTDLLELELASILAGGSPFQQHRLHEPIFLVCTNGRRDACCAKFGLPVFYALDQALRGTDFPGVWQSTHQGGHRFAPNLLCLPQGLSYGRVEPSEVDAILEAQRRGDVYSSKLRGRLCYPDVVQAADAHLRRESGELSLGAFRLFRAVEESPAVWQVQFVRSRTGERYSLVISVSKADEQVYESCSMDKQTPIKEYRLESYDITRQ